LTLREVPGMINKKIQNSIGASLKHSNVKIVIVEKGKPDLIEMHDGYHIDIINI
jgi:hypothetical protein